MSKVSKFLFVISLLALVLGLILSLASALHLCSSACEETAAYRFFGFKFDWLGISFFSLALILYLLSLYMPSLLFFVGLMAAGALGAEIVFLLVQYLDLEEFCPVCVSIALCVILLAFSLLCSAAYNIKLKKEGFRMSRCVVKSLTTFSAFAVGLMLALFGVAIPEHSFADGTSESEDPIFGNKTSPIEIYVISDWYCKACHQFEPKLEQILPAILPNVSVLFIDRMLHPESLNYLPYNLSFMLKEKGKYLKTRQALIKLAESNKNPTPQDVQQAVASLGITYKPLNFSDIESGMRFFQGIFKTFQVNSTPTVVIANKKKIKAKKLVGLDEISKENILLWIDKLSK